jgi:hydroxypyruvate reductase
VSAPPDAPRAILAGLLHGMGALDAAAAMASAADRARDRGFIVLPLGQQAPAEARELAGLHAAIALQSVRHGRPLAPTVLVSAGAVLHGGAPAGPAEFLLALALALDDNRAIYAAACGRAPTAFRMGPDTVPRALALGLAPGAQLAGGTAPAVFAALGETFAVDPAPPYVLRALLITQE